MSKYYVLLEYEPQHEGDVIGIPWVDILQGAVTVTNTIHIDENKLESFETYVGVGQITSDYDDLTREEALKHLIQCQKNGEEDVPENITIHCLHEDDTLEQVLEAIDEAGAGIVNDFKHFFDIDFD